jgi:two-component system phosphate regulon response regulator PhoB
MITILLLEDDPDMQRLIGYKLERAGFHVVPVNDGPAAMSQARLNPPDVAILDVRMPRLGGLDVCRELRADPATATVPIIMLTAPAHSQAADAPRTAGADEYLSDPFSARELRLRVEALLARVRV